MRSWGYLDNGYNYGESGLTLQATIKKYGIVLKQAGGGNYLDELLISIRNIRPSEKVFWRKVLEISATSIDDDPNLHISKDFFAVVRNKMHWVAHGYTAAEIVAQRAGGATPNMALTSWSGNNLRLTDAEIAKNCFAAEVCFSDEKR